MICSTELQGLLVQHVNHLVHQDPRSQDGTGKLGYPFEYIRKCVVGCGLADFNEGHEHPIYGSLSADDVVLLYCYINMKRHLDTAIRVFRRHESTVETFFASEGRHVIMDVGCGPGTACLAIADSWRGKSFAYVGIDTAAPMRQKAHTFWKAAKAISLFGPASTCTFASSWQGMQPDSSLGPTNILLVFSYFFASHSLNETAMRSLTTFICALRESAIVATITAVYINSSVPEAVKMYGVFKQQMRLESRPEELDAGTEYEVLVLKSAGA